MALSLSFSTLISSSNNCTTLDKPTGLISHNCTTIRKSATWLTDANRDSKNVTFETLRVKATEKKAETKVNSLLCGDCQGDGNKKCTQCLGGGVNITDHFNGQFKAGSMCWLCRGKKEILCGNCNGAGFMGGFMSTADS